MKKTREVVIRFKFISNHNWKLIEIFIKKLTSLFLKIYFKNIDISTNEYPLKEESRKSRAGGLLEMLDNLQVPSK
jgi:hypothetical protein